MAGPKLPPDLAKKIAKLAKQAPHPPPAGRMPSAPVAAQAPPAAGAPRLPSVPGDWMKKALIIGWALAAVASAVAYLQFRWASHDKAAALERQAAEYEEKIALFKLDADTRLKNTLADRDAAHGAAISSAQARQAATQAELDYQKLPGLPLRIAFRPPAFAAAPVLNVTNETNTDFTCTVRLRRAGSTEIRELPFAILPRAFRDIGQLDTWEFKRGDVVEFVKAGYKPTRVEAP